MENCPFINRQRELSILDRAYENRPTAIVVYGRRRIGKTMLIREWLRRKKARGAYYLAQLTSHRHNLKLMTTAISEQLGSKELADFTPERLTSLLAMLSQLGVEIVVIDEVTYWIRGDPIVLSELQEFIDLKLPETNMTLILSGSQLGVMQNAVLGGGSPLYARAQHRIRLEALPYKYLKCLLPNLSPQDRVRLYSLVGGIPYYHCILRGARSIKAVIDVLVEKDSPLKTEKDFLLREEFRDPATYNAVLSALARGYNTPTRISQATGVNPGLANKALHTLEYLGLVKREIPLFRRKGWYKIADPILRTWYSLLEPVEALIEMGTKEEAEKRVTEKLDTHTSHVWEELVLKHLVEQYAPRGYTVFGRLLHKGFEIDIALLNPEEKKAIIAEAKWRKMKLLEIERLKVKTTLKAENILPSGYKIEKTIIAVKQVEREAPGEDVVTPEALEETGACQDG